MAQAIVTGGAVRVGRAISVALAKAGYDIILVFHNSFSEAKEVAAEIEKIGRQCFLHKCDLTKKENIDVFFGEVARKYDDIRLLVNNASIFGKYNFVETSEQIFDAHMDINLKAPFFLSQNYLQYINKRAHIDSAHIINILDKNVSGVHTGHFIYHITKKSFFHLTASLAKELAPKVRVNAISPGSILSANHYVAGQKHHSHIPLTEKEKQNLKLVTDKVLHLDSSKDLTGQNIVVDIAE